MARSTATRKVTFSNEGFPNFGTSRLQTMEAKEIELRQERWVYEGPYERIRKLTWSCCTILRDASPAGLVSIAEETLAEFLSKATGTAVEWIQMPGMKTARHRGTDRERDGKVEDETEKGEDGRVVGGGRSRGCELQYPEQSSHEQRNEQLCFCGLLSCSWCPLTSSVVLSFP